MAITSSSPTAERLAHGPVAPPQIDEHAFKPFWRACDRLEKLRASGAITAHEYRAAIAFRTTYERAHAGPGGPRAADLTAVRVDKHCRRRMPEMAGAQTAALARLHRIGETLGSLYALLEMALIEETSWAELGRRYGIDPHTARTWCLAAISALAVL